MSFERDISNSFVIHTFLKLFISVSHCRYAWYDIIHVNDKDKDIKTNGNNAADTRTTKRFDFPLEYLQQRSNILFDPKITTKSL